MVTRAARQDNPRLQAPDLWPPCDGQQPGVLIIGTRRGEVFVATQVLISVDTLGDEVAIRAWLAKHDIHVAPACRSEASTPKGSTDAIGS
jgi:hypothetical protein